MSRFHTLKIADVRRETRDSVSVLLTVPDALKAEFSFAPGQYLTLRTTIDGEDIRRSYSICSGVLDNELRIGVKKVDGGAFSTFANENLKAGDSVEVMPPDGRFTPDLTASAGRHILGIAAGSGITPILSIAKSALAADPATRVTVIYGNQTSGTVMFAEELEDLKNRNLGRFSLVHILSREAQDLPILSGRISAEKLRALADSVIDLAHVDQAFLCGPQGMVDEAKQALHALGLAPEKIRTELFTASEPRKAWKPPQGAAATQVIAQVTATLDGKKHSFAMTAGDENVVEAAARHGIELPYSCKGGMCCTCRCRVEQGAVEMAQNFSLEEWETKAGFVLACQSRPTTPQLAIDFDQI
ncbi:MAG: 1,2-phenylacetyl-CoA epoxidase subunit PaaE [Beijerinckiaceae bacterium]